MSNNHSNKTTLFIIEKQPLSRAGYTMIFGTDATIEIVGESDDLSSGMEKIAATKPAVILLRVDNVDRDLEELSVVRASHPESKVLILSEELEPAAVAKFIGAGASGCCCRNVNVENLLAAIHAIAAGGMWFDPSASAIMRGFLSGDLQLSNSQSGPPSPSVTPVLTERENEILRQLAAGLTNQQIAERLHLSVETVKTYVRRIMDKSAIRSRRELLIKYKKRP